MLNRMYPTRIQGQFTGLCLALYLLLPLLQESFLADRWAVGLLAMMSVWLIVSANPRLNQTKFKSFFEMILLAGAALVLALQIYGDIVKLRYVTGILLLGSLLSAYYGRRPVLTMLATVCLGLIIPVPYGLEQSVGLWLATYEAQMFVSLAQFLGLPLYQFGTQVISGEVAITINSNCSGTLLFVPALMGCCVAASFPAISQDKRLIILACALPFAFAVNLLRLLILMVINFNAPEEIVTAFHDMLGWFVMPIVWAIPVAIFAPLDSLQFTFTPKFWKQTIVVTSAFGISLGFYQFEKNTYSEPTGLSGDIPVYIAGWTGETKTVPKNESELIAADYLIRRVYYAPDEPRELVFTAVFHSDLRVSKQHSSRACFEALGWQVSAISSKMERPNVSVEHILVKSHVQVQAVTEITLKLRNQAGALRLQFVESPKVSVEARHRTALAFMKRINEKLELEI